MVELKISKLNKLEANLEDNMNTMKKTQQAELLEQQKNQIEGLVLFLDKYSESLDSSTVFQTFQNHGRINDCLTFALQKVILVYSKF